ncbi:globin domain-containing protein, partial [Tepidimonas sp.]|uniref:globin domain-containing protein n=1 Tax=Tepidimonas sp. TaxID=2002775 RepID=UPI002FE3445D
TPYEALGGADGVQRLVQRFYDLMDTLPEAWAARRIHPDDLRGARQSLFEFLSGWLGGPPLYEQKKGHPRLRMRHLPYAIGPAERDAWMLCMRTALTEQVADTGLREALLQALGALAEHMINTRTSAAAATDARTPSGTAVDAPLDPDRLPLIDDELDVLASLVPLAGTRLIELGCGPARLARTLVQRYPGSHVVGLEVDAVQHARNLAQPQAGLTFVAAGAEAIPFPDAHFDGALMLKSLHHVPLVAMDAALQEVARVVRPGGWLYVSEPIYGGALNEIVRLYNDEGKVRAAAQAALDRAVARGHPWQALAQRRFAQPVRYRDWADFAQRMLYPTFADHRITPELAERVRAAFEPHLGPDGATFVRPMHVRLLRRV